MKFALYDHAGKGQYLRQRLVEAGHEEATPDNAEGLDLVVADCDWPWAFPRPDLIRAATEHGAKVALYPHGGRPTCWVYDGITEPDGRVDLRLEHGPGSAEIADTLGLDLKQEAVGWLFCPTAEFEPVAKPAKILFAPLHPNIEMIQKGTNGHDPAPALNNRVYRDLLDLKWRSLTVTVVGPIWRHGVWYHPKARFLGNPQMIFHHSFEQILHADVVVAAGTMAAAAVALGKPTVMFDQDTFADYVGGRYVEAEHQDDYRDLVRYPIDIDDGPLPDLIARACKGSKAVREWREKWVGNDGTERAVALLEDLVGVASASDVTIQGVTATANSAT